VGAGRNLFQNIRRVATNFKKRGLANVLSECFEQFLDEP